MKTCLAHLSTYILLAYYGCSYQLVSQHFLEHVKREEDGQPYEISIVMIGAYCSGSLEDTSD